jgi:DNA-binding beta-propeller fold protein YncE
MTDPMLTYSLNPAPFPLQASAPTGGLSPATLTIVGTNATAAAVSLQGLSITLSVSEDATGLTPDPTGISPVQPPGWSAATMSVAAGTATWTFLPAPGSGGAITVPAGGSLTFTLNQVQVNRVPGFTPVTVMEGSGGCSPPQCPTTKTLGVTKFPNGWRTVSFSASPPEVPQGGGPTLRWSGPSGATYHINYYTPQTGVVLVPADGEAPFAPVGTYPPAANPLSLQQTTTFTLLVTETVHGQTYNAQCQATVAVELPDAVITRFTGTVGGSRAEPTLTLHWATRNAIRCQIGGFSEELGPSGSWPSQTPLQMPLQQSYTLTAWNAANVPTTATWHMPPAIASFGGTPRVTVSGNSVAVALELTWAALLADSCTLSGVAGTVAASGSHTFKPTVAAPLATAYTLAAVNGPQTTTATVNVAWGVSAVQVQAYPGMCLGLAATADGASLLLGTSADGSSFQVTRLDAATLAVTQTSPDLPWQVGAVAVSPDGSRVFAQAFINGGVLALDGVTLKPVGSWSPPADSSITDAGGLAVTPDGKRLLVSVPGGVTALNAATLHPLGVSTSLSPQPQRLAVSPDGTRVYVACGLGGDGCVAVLNAVTLQPVAGSPVTLPGALDVSVSPDGALVFVTSDSLAVIDAATLQRIGPDVQLGDFLADAASAVDGSRVFALNALGMLRVMVPSGVTRAG